jgi:hypothetical protein
MTEVSRDGIPIGFMWLSRMSDRAVEMHACAEPAQFGRLVNKQVLAEFKKMMLDSGAHHVVALHGNPVYRRLLVKLGFTSHSTYVTTIDLRTVQWDS